MEYIIINNGIISAHQCSKKVPEGAVVLEDFYGRVGDPVTYYHDDWTPKTRIELISKGIKEMPDGYTWMDDTHTQIREMTEIEKYKHGVLQSPAGMRLVGDRLVRMTDLELYNTGVISIDEYAERVRNERTSKIESIQWRLQRYQQQRDAGIATTDKASWYDSALIYVQTLREVPQQEGFPLAIRWPAEPMTVNTGKVSQKIEVLTANYPIKIEEKRS